MMGFRNSGSGTLGLRSATTIVLSVLLLVLVECSGADDHSEELLLVPLEDGATLVRAIT